MKLMINTNVFQALSLPCLLQRVKDTFLEERHTLTFQSPA